jgi:hypothetical protein
MFGLSDRHIARVPFPAVPGYRLMKWDNAYVVSRSPDLIVINRGYFRAGDPRQARVEREPSLLVRTAMDRDLFAHVEADGRYRVVPVRFEDGAVFFVFVRGSQSQ